MDLLSVLLLKKIIYQETKSLNMQLKVEVKHEIIRIPLLRTYMY